MFTFPTHLFNPSHVLVRPAKATISGGESLSGDSDVVQTDGGGFWFVTYRGILLNSPDLIRAWRAWEDMLEDGVTKVLVPVVDLRQAPRPFIAGLPGRPSALRPSSNDPYFPEAKAFATPWIIARITGAAALRATQVTIYVERGQRLKGGEVFAVNHPTLGRRIYRIRRVLSYTGQTATVSIRTPLREAVTADTPVDFDWPTLTATLVPGTDISPDIEYGRSAMVDIAFREAF